MFWLNMPALLAKGRIVSKPKKIRVTIDLREKLFERLEALAESMGGKSKVEIFKDALQLLEFFVNKRREGYSVVLQKTGEADRVIEVIGLSS